MNRLHTIFCGNGFLGMLPLIRRSKEAFLSITAYGRRLQARDKKKATAERNRLVREVAKRDDLSGLSQEDKELAGIMLEHEEFHNQESSCKEYERMIPHPLSRDSVFSFRLLIAEEPFCM